jgi:predicted sulfurtransferase
MKTIKILLCLLMASSNAFSSISISEFEVNANQKSTDAYINGLASGLDAANNSLTLKKKTSLYCLPPFLKLSTSDYKEIITLGMKDIPANQPGRGSIDIDGILLKKLIALYPCGYN